MIKHILVPTDFSSNALNALHYAISLAKAFDSHIHLIHTYEVPSHSGVLIDLGARMRADAEQQIERIVKSELENSKGVQVFYKVHEGSLKTTIKEYVKIGEADLVVMGTKGATGLQEVFLGSNTVAAIRSCRAPLLAVPEGAVFSPITKIALAVDDEIVHDSSTLEPLYEFIKAFKSTMAVIHVEDDDEPDDIEGDFRKVFQDENFEFHLVSGDHVSEIVQTFAVSIHADILCMITRRRRWFIDRLISGSVTYKAAFHANLPLLVLPDANS